MNKVFSLFNASWLRWSIFTAIGSGLGFLLENILPLDPDRYFSHHLAVFAIIGLLTSLGQWIVLRTHLRHAWLWIPATTLGFTLGYEPLLVPSDKIWALISPISIGLLVGLFQSLAARSTIKNSLVWIIVSTISWGLAYRFVLDYFFMKLISITFGFILGALIGLVIGAISGFFIEHFWTKPNKVDALIAQKEAS
jgi:hypothetical protein